MFSEAGWKLSLHERLFVLKQPLSWERDASWGLAQLSHTQLLYKPILYMLLTIGIGVAILEYYKMTIRRLSGILNYDWSVVVF